MENSYLRTGTCKSERTCRLTYRLYLQAASQHPARAPTQGNLSLPAQSHPQFDDYRSIDSTSPITVLSAHLARARSISIRRD